MSKSITVRSICKEYVHPRGTVHVLKNICIEIKEGEIVTLFGPNGSGKSTLLNIVAGIDTPTSGEVFVGGKSPQDVAIGFIFQDYNESLFPWKNVFDNIIFPLRMNGVNIDQAIDRADTILADMGLEKIKGRFIYELSGGQRQLVAICRAMVCNPDILIMDEPFSSLDYSTARKIEQKLLDVWAKYKPTTLFVSHDIDEAIFLADKVIVISSGPAEIKKTFNIDLPRPRRLDMLTSIEFAKIRNDILHEFML
jgi:NitT/TauT family transport system ATP-binding protein